MTKRFGRNQKRALKKTIKRLEYAAYGPYGECPSHVPSIDDLPITYKSIRIEDNPRNLYEVSVSIEVPNDGMTMDRIRFMQENPVSLDGRCLHAVQCNVPQSWKFNSDPRISIDFKQVMSPRR